MHPNTDTESEGDDDMNWDIEYQALVAHAIDVKSERALENGVRGLVPSQTSLENIHRTTATTTPFLAA
eukprot:12873374-Prorocentrum_lima.AAC.1